MKKMFFFLAFLLAFPGFVFAQNVQYSIDINGKNYTNTTTPSVASTGSEHIQNFDAQIQIHKDGTITDKETILYDFGSQQKHGNYR